MKISPNKNTFAEERKDDHSIYGKQSVEYQSIEIKPVQMTNIQAYLQKYFGYSNFRQQQEQIIQSVLESKDVLVLMPTGGGKSICYQIPALMMEGTAIILSPLIALMKDQVVALRANGIEAHYLNSSLSSLEESEIIKLLLEQKIKLLYLSPEKLLSLIGNLLTKIKISIIAIDEAHCISQWGHDFRPEYTQLHLLKEYFPNIPIIALTATADKTTRKDIIKQLQLEEAETFISSFDRPNLYLEVRSQVPEKEKMYQIYKLIRSQKNECGIIYCMSRKGTENMVQLLKDEGIDAEFYHAGMTSEDRNRVQENFIYDKTKIICATIAFGMGIDKSNVRWIVHNNLPKNIESYYQEIGRAGRDGLSSKTILFFNFKDLAMLTKFATESGQSELNLEKLNRMHQYADSTICRRRTLLSYFGEHSVENCNHCDCCKNPSKFQDGTLICQKAISCVLRTNEQVGIQMLLDILRGLNHKELMEENYHLIKTHGVGRDLSQDEWKFYISQMMQSGIFEMAYEDKFTLKVSSLGKNVVLNKQKIELPIYDKVYIPSKKEKLKEKSQTSKVDLLENTDQDIFEYLRSIRLELARKEKLPPYVIFHDSTLKQMASEMPKNKSEMLRLSGMSENKYNKYGLHFESGIRRYLRLPELEPPDVIEEAFSILTIQNQLKQLKNFKKNVSWELLAKIYFASPDIEIDEQMRDLEFYGSLRGVMKKSEIENRLRKLALENENLFDQSNHEIVKKFFDQEKFNHWSEEEIFTFQTTMSSYPILRKNDELNNDYILEERKTFPRSYEPWEHEEAELLELILKKTNDIDLLSKTFNRSQSSITSFIKKNIFLTS